MVRFRLHSLHSLVPYVPAPRGVPEPVRVVRPHRALQFKGSLKYKVYPMYSNIGGFNFINFQIQIAPRTHTSYFRLLIVRRPAFRVAAAAALDSNTDTVLYPVMH